MMPCLYLNVNFPKKSKEAFKGVYIFRQEQAKWQEEFDERIALPIRDLVLA